MKRMGLGKKVRHLMELRKVESVAELSRLTGVSRTLAHQIYSDQVDGVTVKTIERLAKGLKVEVSFFLESDSTTLFLAVDHLPDDIASFVLEADSLPFLSLGKKLKEDGKLTPEAAEQLLGFVSQLINQKSRN